jgi:hypothetical protein
MNWCTKGKKYQLYVFEHETPAVNKLLPVGFMVLAVMTIKSAIFWDVSGLAYSSNLKVETVFSFETSVDFYRSIRPYAPEDGTLKVTTYCKRKKSTFGEGTKFYKNGQI